MTVLGVAERKAAAVGGEWRATLAHGPVRSNHCLRRLQTGSGGVVKMIPTAAQMLVFLRLRIYAVPLLIYSYQRDPFTELRIACGGVTARSYPWAGALGFVN